MKKTKSRLTTTLANLMLSLIFLLFTPFSIGQTQAQFPSQWLAKIGTEALGNAPDSTTWVAQKAWWNAITTSCDASSIALLGSYTYKSSDFLTRYDGDNLSRLVALFRGALNQELPVGGFTPYFYTSLESGATTWPDYVDQIFQSPQFLDLVPSICSTTEPDFGFGSAPVEDILTLTGAGSSRSQAAIQALLDAAAGGCGTVELAQHELIAVAGTPLTVPSCVKLQTAGQPQLSAYASMARVVASGPICGGDGCTYGGIIRVKDGATVRNIWLDGNNAKNDTNGLALIVVDSGVLTTTLTELKFSDPPLGGSAVNFEGWSLSAINCDKRVMTNSLVTGYGRADDQTGSGAPLWADGVRVQCENTFVSSNAFVDISGTAISVMGSWNSLIGNLPPPWGPNDARKVQESDVTQNSISNIGVSGIAGIELDPVGMCRARNVGHPVACIEFNDTRDDSPLNPETGEPEIVPKRSFVGTNVDDNILWSGDSVHLDVAILVGGFPRFGNNTPLANGASITGNDTGPAGLRAQTGLLASGMHNLYWHDNDFTNLSIESAGTHWDGGCASGEAVSAFLLTSFAPGSDPADIKADVVACLIPTPPSEGRTAISVNGNGIFVDEAGTPFTPWGHNYSQSHVQTKKEMLEVRNLGANTIRIFPQFRDMMLSESGSEAGCDQINAAAIIDLQKTADYAAEIGIYLDVTGLGSFSGDLDDPSCYRDATREQRFTAQEVYWAGLTDALINSPAVLMFNLMNEPRVRAWDDDVPCWSSDLEFEHEDCFAGLPEPYEDTDAFFSQNLSRDQILWTTAEEKLAARRTIAENWLDRLVEAIKGEVGFPRDPDRLITVGCHPEHDCGIGLSPVELATYLDVLSVHVYPHHKSGELTGLEEEHALVAAYAAAGKPVVIEEIFLWPGSEILAQNFIQETRVLGTADGWLGQYGLGLTMSQDRVPLIGQWGALMEVDHPYYDWKRLFQLMTSEIAPCHGCTP